MATSSESSTITEAEHRRQLRRAVLASTIGTAIEWYDFFLYSTVTGLVFAKLYFPRADPLVGTVEAFGVYAVGFVARPIGAAIFGHYGDRLGRKAALVATLLLMGIGTFLVALVPGYEHIGIWGGVILTDLALYSGYWGGRRVGRLRASLHGMGAVEPPPRFHHLLAAVRRTGGPVPLELSGPRDERHIGGAFHHVGLARAFPPQHPSGGARPVHPVRHSGDPGVHPACSGAPD